LIRLLSRRRENVIHAEKSNAFIIARADALRDTGIAKIGAKMGGMTVYAPEFSCEYSFDELSIRLCDRWETGLLLYGRAELRSAGADYEDEFYVSAIRLDGGARLARPNASNNVGGFESELFRRIAAVIEDDRTQAGRHAAELFAIELEQSREADHDQSHKIRQERTPEMLAPTH
jgi:hypothetical protein